MHANLRWTFVQRWAQGSASLRLRGTDGHGDPAPTNRLAPSSERIIASTSWSELSAREQLEWTADAVRAP